MNAFKVLFSVLLITANLSVAHGQRGARMGYIDMEYILENVPEYQEAKTSSAQKSIVGNANWRKCFKK